MIIVYFGKHGKPGWSSELKALALYQGHGSNAGKGFIFMSRKGPKVGGGDVRLRGGFEM